MATAPASRPPRITAVIATHDNRVQLIEALDGLARQDGVDAGEFDVIVVVDGCTDGTADALSSYDAPFQLTVLDQVRSGLAAARNRGLAAARGEITLFLDDDVIPEPSLIAGHRSLQSLSLNCVVLGEIISSAMRRSPWDAYDDAMREKRQTALRTTEQPSGIHSARNLSVRRDLVKAAGGFRGHLPGNQEVELGYRLREAGAQFIFSRSAAAEDRGRSDYRSWKERQSTRGKLDVATYHQSPDGQGLDRLLACFNERHPLTRIVVAALLRQRRVAPHAIRWAERTAVLAYSLSFAGLSRVAYSVIANTLYWSGVRDSVRGNRAFFSLLKTARHSPALAKHRTQGQDSKPAVL
jgi:glycosyltransferase involved in cell wall biosynthesis